MKEIVASMNEKNINDLKIVAFRTNRSLSANSKYRLV
jgi:hypothetical protein